MRSHRANMSHNYVSVTDTASQARKPADLNANRPDQGAPAPLGSNSCDTDGGSAGAREYFLFGCTREHRVTGDPSLIEGYQAQPVSEGAGELEAPGEGVPPGVVPPLPYPVGQG